MYKHNEGLAVSPERIAVIENKIEEILERIENIEKQIIEDREGQLKKLKAELDYAKLSCDLSDVCALSVIDLKLRNNIQQEEITGKER